MSHFVGCQSLVMFKFMLFLFLGFSEAVRENPFLELSSREELVQLAGYGEEKLSTVLVTGTVLCEACLDKQLHSSPASGASVAVICHINGKKKRTTCAHGIADEYGDFVIDLPSQLHAIPNLERACLVRVVGIPRKSLCHPSILRKHKEIKLSSVGNGIRTYTAGRMRFLRLTPQSSQSCIKQSNAGEEMSW